MGLHEAGPSHLEIDDSAVAAIIDKATPDLEAIFTCKFPGCTRQYASTDGVRKHCRKSHPEWLREVDADKANHGCRWAAYCTRESITEGNDPRTTPVGSKRAREIMAQGGHLPPMGMSSGLAEALSENKACASCAAATTAGFSRGASSSFGFESSSSRQVSFGLADDSQSQRAESKAPRLPAHSVAMDGKSALVPLRPFPSTVQLAPSSENMMPPEMIALPGELSSPLPVNVSALTPNAQARARLGEIADSESICLQGGTTYASQLPSSPAIDARDVGTLAAHALQTSHGANSFFAQWGMPPLKRGMSLADTRESSAQHAQQMTALYPPPTNAEIEEACSQDSPSFLDSVLA